MVKIFDIDLSKLPEGFNDPNNIWLGALSNQMLSKTPAEVETLLNELTAWTDPSVPPSGDLNSLMITGSRNVIHAAPGATSFGSKFMLWEYGHNKVELNKIILHFYDSEGIVSLSSVEDNAVDTTYYVFLTAMNSSRTEMKSCWGKSTLNIDTSVQFVPDKHNALDSSISINAKLSKYPDVSNLNFGYYLSTTDPKVNNNWKANSEPVHSDHIIWNNGYTPVNYNKCYIPFDDIRSYTISSSLSPFEENPSYFVLTETLNPGTATEEEVVLSRTPVWFPIV